MGQVKESFTQEYLNKLNAITLRFENKAKGGYSGSRRSKAKGSSTEFSDFKDYTQGDDLRRIDWNSYARLGKLFVKLYEEEKQVTINIFLDISKSMDFGNPNKFIYAKVIAASIVYIASNTVDRVNIYTVNNNLLLKLKSLSSRKSFSIALDYLDTLDADGTTSFESAFKAVPAAELNGGITIIMSDFFDREVFENAFSMIRAKSGLTYAMQFLSPQEIDPVYDGGIRFVDNETLGNVDLDMDDIVKQYYLEELRNYNNKLDIFFKSKNIDYIFVNTSTPYLEWLWKLKG